MTDSRSVEVFKGLRDAQQKLDYFMLGLASALFAYVGGKYDPMPLSFSQNTVELISLGLFLISILAGFKRLDINITLMQLNFRKLDMNEKKGALVQGLSMRGDVLNTDTGEPLDRSHAQQVLGMINSSIPKIENYLENYSEYSAWSSDIRNWSLIIGFIALGFSKVMGVYHVS